MNATELMIRIFEPQVRAERRRGSTRHRSGSLRGRSCPWGYKGAIAPPVTGKHGVDSSFIPFLGLRGSQRAGTRAILVWWMVAVRSPSAWKRTAWPQLLFPNVNFPYRQALDLLKKQEADKKAAANKKTEKKKSVRRGR